jgi:hypothetical protein
MKREFTDLNMRHLEAFSKPTSLESKQRHLKPANVGYPNFTPYENRGNAFSVDRASECSARLSQMTGPRQQYFTPVRR